MIKLFDTIRQYEVIKNKVDSAVKRVFEAGNFILGNEVDELEEWLKEYTNSMGCVGVANGTDALQIALMAIDLKPGDKVIVPSFTWVSSVEVIKLLGAVPVYIDIDPIDFCYSLDELEKLLVQEKPKAFIAVSLFGNASKIEKATDLCRIHGATCIEDAAQSFGAKCNNKMSCSIADISTTSFFPSKPLGCFGDGGAIFSNDQNLTRICREISRHGQIERYRYSRVGLNSRLDTVQAAILLEKVKIFENEISLRNNLAKKYDEALKNLDELSTPNINQEINRSVWAQYTLLLKDESRRSDLLESFKKNKIQAALYYPVPLHSNPIYRSNNAVLTKTEEICKKVISIPMHPYLSEKEQAYIIETLKNFYD